MNDDHPRIEQAPDGAIFLPEDRHYGRSFFSETQIFMMYHRDLLPFLHGQIFQGHNEAGEAQTIYLDARNSSQGVYIWQLEEISDGMHYRTELRVVNDESDVSAKSVTINLADQFGSIRELPLVEIKLVIDQVLGILKNPKVEELAQSQRSYRDELLPKRLHAELEAYHQKLGMIAFWNSVDTYTNHDLRLNAEKAKAKRVFVTAIELIRGSIVNIGFYKKDKKDLDNFLTNKKG